MKFVVRDCLLHTIRNNKDFDVIPYAVHYIVTILQVVRYIAT